MKTTDTKIDVFTWLWRRSLVSLVIVTVVISGHLVSGVVIETVSAGVTVSVLTVPAVTGTLPGKVAAAVTIVTLDLPVLPLVVVLLLHNDISVSVLQISEQVVQKIFSFLRDIFDFVRWFLFVSSKLMIFILELEDIRIQLRVSFRRILQLC